MRNTTSRIVRDARPAPAAMEQLEGRQYATVVSHLPNSPQLLIDGKATELKMYGTYGMAADRGFDYASAGSGFFDTLKRHNINGVRVWVNYHWANDLSPFKDNGVSGQGRKYDLAFEDKRGRLRAAKKGEEQFNAAFFSRLKDFVAQADQRGIVVQLDLFDGVQLESKTNRWKYSPYNAANNDGHFLEGSARGNFFKTSGKGSELWKYVNKPLVQRVGGELSSFRNVIYQPVNEPPPISNEGFSASVNDVYSFHNAVASTIESTLRAARVDKNRIVISANAPIPTAKDPATGQLYNKLAADSTFDMISVHLGDVTDSFAFTATYQSGRKTVAMKKPVIISTDGSGGYSTLNLSNLQKRVASARAGTVHIEILDNASLVNHWTYNSDRYPDYNPVNRPDAQILKLLE